MLYQIWMRHATYDELLATIHAGSRAEAERIQGELGMTGAELVEVDFDLRGLRRMEKVYSGGQYEH